MCGQLTSEVLDEVLQLHLPLRLDIGAVHVCVEQDDGKGQDKDGVWVPELPHHPRVADAVPLAGEEVHRGLVREPLSPASLLHLVGGERSWVELTLSALPLPNLLGMSLLPCLCSSGPKAVTSGWD